MRLVWVLLGLCLLWGVIAIAQVSDDDDCVVKTVHKFSGPGEDYSRDYKFCHGNRYVVFPMEEE